MARRERYEHLTVAQALRALAKESNITKGESEMLFQIAEKIDEKFDSTFIFDLPEVSSPPTDEEVAMKMRSLIEATKYDEARKLIDKRRPEWRKKCEWAIQSHSIAIPAPSKEESFNEICELLGFDEVSLGRGSTVRKSFYKRVIVSLGLKEIKDSLPEPPTTKQGLAKFIIEQSGLGSEWKNTYSSNGGTVTADGLNLVLLAVRKIEAEA
jgi:hypothetical protein